MTRRWTWTCVWFGLLATGCGLDSPSDVGATTRAAGAPNIDCDDPLPSSGWYLADANNWQSSAFPGWANNDTTLKYNTPYGITFYGTPEQIKRRRECRVRDTPGNYVYQYHLLKVGHSTGANAVGDRWDDFSCGPNKLVDNHRVELARWYKRAGEWMEAKYACVDNGLYQIGNTSARHHGAAPGEIFKDKAEAACKQGRKKDALKRGVGPSIYACNKQNGDLVKQEKRDVGNARVDWARITGPGSHPFDDSTDGFHNWIISRTSLGDGQYDLDGTGCKRIGPKNQIDELVNSPRSSQGFRNVNHNGGPDKLVRMKWTGDGWDATPAQGGVRTHMEENFLVETRRNNYVCNATSVGDGTRIMYMAEFDPGMDIFIQGMNHPARSLDTAAKPKGCTDCDEWGSCDQTAFQGSTTNPVPTDEQWADLRSKALKWGAKRGIKAGISKIFGGDPGDLGTHGKALWREVVLPWIKASNLSGWWSSIQKDIDRAKYDWECTSEWKKFRKWCRVARPDYPEFRIVGHSQGAIAAAVWDLHLDGYIGSVGTRHTNTAVWRNNDDVIPFVVDVLMKFFVEFLREDGRLSHRSDSWNETYFCKSNWVCTERDGIQTSLCKAWKDMNQDGVYWTGDRLLTVPNDRDFSDHHLNFSGGMSMSAVDHNGSPDGMRWFDGSTNYGWKTGAYRDTQLGANWDQPMYFRTVAYKETPCDPDGDNPCGPDKECLEQITNFDGIAHVCRVPDCDEGDKRCYGDQMIQTCDANGVWSEPVLCDGQNECRLDDDGQATCAACDHECDPSTYGTGDFSPTCTNYNNGEARAENCELNPVSGCYRKVERSCNICWTDGQCREKFDGTTQPVEAYCCLGEWDKCGRNARLQNTCVGTGWVAPECCSDDPEDPVVCTDALSPGTFTCRRMADVLANEDDLAGGPCVPEQAIVGTPCNDEGAAAWDAAAVPRLALECGPSIDDPGELVYLSIGSCAGEYAGTLDDELACNVLACIDLPVVCAVDDSLNLPGGNEGECACSNGGALYTCDAAGGWTLSDNCASGVCDSTTCVCRAPNDCSAPAGPEATCSCNGTVLSKCAAGEWSEVAQCSDADACDAANCNCGGCGPAEEGQQWCSEGNLYTCTAGQWAFTEMCADGSCSANGNGCESQTDCTQPAGAEGETQCNALTGTIIACSDGAWSEVMSCGVDQCVNGYDPYMYVRAAGCWPLAEPVVGSCAGACGAVAAAGCYCDADCWSAGDCCEDVCSACGTCEPAAAAAAVCGDGVCDLTEGDGACPEDCGGCGDAVCDAGEDAGTCPADCGGSMCGDAMCDSDEDTTTCPADCVGSMCGDAMCDPGEDAMTCPADCGGP